MTLHAGSIVEREGEDFYNTSLVFGPDGKQIARYRKIHLFDVETPEGVNRPRFLDQLRLEFSDFIQGGGLVEPPDFISEIGTLLPIAPCGRNSL